MSDGAFSAPSSSSENDSDNESTIGLDSFFDSALEFKKKRYEFAGGAIHQDVWVSTGASTDHDRTGLVLWPIAEHLASFICEQGKEFFVGRQVLELGAGCGLLGLVASQFASRTILTDGNNAVLNLLQRNAELNGGNSVEVRQLRWGMEGDVLDLLETFGPPEVIVAADVVCWPDFVSPLVATVKSLLVMHDSSIFFLGIVNRANQTYKLFLDTARRAGLNVSHVGFESKIKAKEELELEILHICVNENAVKAVDWPAPPSATMPC